jgi:hypothetical protein
MTLIRFGRIESGGEKHGSSTFNFSFQTLTKDEGLIQAIPTHLLRKCGTFLRQQSPKITEWNRKFHLVEDPLLAIEGHR